MAKPNYSFEKRQRELAKKKKKEEKAREKVERKAGDQTAATGQDGADAEVGTTDGSVEVQGQPAP